MWIALNHRPLRFGTCLVSAPLSPGNKKLLIGSKAIERGRRRFALLRFLERQGRDLGSGHVADASSSPQFAVVMNFRLDEVAVKLFRHASGTALEILEIVRCPPIVERAQRIELRALIVKAVADF